MLIRSCTVTLSLLLIWQILIMLFHLPAFILPTPYQVFHTLITQFSLIAQQTQPTLIEIVCGLFFATLLGCSLALSMHYFRWLRFWLAPVLIISQALPTFAIAPLFIIWFGYGITTKIAIVTLMLFFPITSAFYDGLRRTNLNWLDLAHTMDATSWQILRHICLPAALPNLASGLRIATAAAPLGAIIGEWVGSSNGLGFLLLNANARMQIDLSFAVLFVVIVLSLSLYFSINYLLRKLIWWDSGK